MKPIRLFPKRLLNILPLLLAALVVSCEVQDFGEILETAGDEIRWYSVVQHAGVPLRLEIPADGSFTEPRNANMITIVAELPEPVDPASITSANIDFIGRDNADAVCDPAFSVDMDEAHTQVWIIVFGLTDIARYRIRIKNNSGVELSQRVFARLMGDVDGSGSVLAPDAAIVNNLINDSIDFNPSIVTNIRADIDYDSLHLNPDLAIVTLGFGTGVTAIVPPFP